MTPPLRNQSNGFTLIEIVMVLVILGILGGVASAKYFDMSESAQLQAAASTVSTIQSRINAEFGNRTLAGDPCLDAVAFLGDISNLTETGTGNTFGDYEIALTPAGNTSTVRSTGTAAFARKSGDLQYFATNKKLFVPTCNGNIEEVFTELSKETLNATAGLENVLNANAADYTSTVTVGDITVTVTGMQNIEDSDGNTIYKKYMLDYEDAVGNSFHFEIQEYNGLQVIREASYQVAEAAQDVRIAFSSRV